MNEQFTNLNKGRSLMLKVIDGLTIEQLNTIPKGFKNNIAWNVAHLVVTQQLLCYRISGIPCLVSEEMITKYRKGAAPSAETSGKITESEFETIKELLVKLPLKLEEDYKRGLFKEYTSYTTSVVVTLTDIDSAIQFNSFHEGIHLGVLLAMKKLV